MSDKITTISAYIGSLWCTFTSFIQTSDILVWIQFSIGIACAMVTTILKIISWYKKAKEDNTITSEEIDELKDIVSDAKQDVNNIVNKDK